MENEEAAENEGAPCAIWKTSGGAGFFLVELQLCGGMAWFISLLR